MKTQTIYRILMGFLILTVSVFADETRYNGTWTPLGPEGGWIQDIVQDPSDSQILYAVHFGEPSRIHKSTDNGITWRVISQIDEDVYALAIDPENTANMFAASDHRIYISNDGGNWNGVYITTDGGQTWNDMTTAGMLDEYVKAIEYDHVNNALFVGTNNGGVHRYTIATGVDKPEDDQTLPHEYTLFQNYPKPFNSETVIQYSIPQKSHVTIKVYSLLGKEIKTITNVMKESGVYTARWNGVDISGSDVPSGIYLYQLKAGDFAETRKLILTR